MKIYTVTNTYWAPEALYPRHFASTREKAEEWIAKQPDGQGYDWEIDEEEVDGDG